MRFAYVNTPSSEKIKETFDLHSLPQSVLYRDGIFYEQQMMQILYNNVVKFIELEYKDPEKVYNSFATLRLLNKFELKFKYVYNYVWR